MKNQLAIWSLIGLCLSMAAAIGGGLYEQIVLTPLWSASPPASFSIIQPGTGIPLQNFWIPVHGAITIFIILALFASWKERKVRRLLLLGLASYIVATAGPSSKLDFLDMVQRAARHTVVRLFCVGGVLVETA